MYSIFRIVPLKFWEWNIKVLGSTVDNACMLSMLKTNIYKNILIKVQKHWSLSCWTLTEMPSAKDGIGVSSGPKIESVPPPVPTCPPPELDDNEVCIRY